MSAITVIAFGSHGDVAPYLGLSRQLADEGHHVVLAAQQPYRALIQEAGFAFRPLPGDTETATRESPVAQAFVDGTRMRPSRALLDRMVEELRPLGPAIAEAAAGADLLLLPAAVSLLGWHVADALGLPSAGVYLQPVTPTADFAPSVLTARSFGKWGNRLLGQLGHLGERPYLPLIKELRTSLGAAPTAGRDHRRRRTRWPIVHGFSRHVVARPADWPDNLTVSGYWWPTIPEGWQPPRQLVDFLDAGPAPIYVGFGSTATAQGDRLSDLIVSALRAAGKRGVINPVGRGCTPAGTICSPSGMCRTSGCFPGWPPPYTTAAPVPRPPHCAPAYPRSRSPASWISRSGPIAYTDSAPHRRRCAARL